MTCKSTDGLKVRLTDSCKTVCLLLYKVVDDMFIIHLQFTAWFCEIGDLERENTFWKRTLPQLSPVYLGWRNWHSLPAKCLRHKTHPSSVSQSKHLSLQLVQSLPYWFTSHKTIWLLLYMVCGLIYYRHAIYHFILLSDRKR